MPLKETDTAYHDEGGKSRPCEVEVQIHLPGASRLTTIQTRIDEAESVCLLTDRLVHQSPHLKDAIVHYAANHGGNNSTHKIIIDFGNGRATNHNLCCSRPFSDPAAIVVKRACVRLFMTHGDFEYLLSPGENAFEILKLQDDDFTQIRLRVEITHGEQELPTFEGTAVLDAAGNICFTSLLNTSDDECSLNEECETKHMKKLPLKETIIATAKKTSTTKKVESKDPALPKKNVTAYIHFMKSIRDEIKAKNPNLGFADIGTLIGKLFRDLAEDDRRRWDEVAQADKTRCENELVKYQKTKGSSQQIERTKAQEGEDEKKKSCDISAGQIQEINSETKTPTKKRRRQSNKQASKDENEPKKNVTAYIHYAMHLRDEIRAKNPNLDFAGIGIEIGKKYRELSEDERRHWEQISLLDKERYKREKNDHIIQINAKQVLENKTVANNNNAVDHCCGRIKSTISSGSYSSTSQEENDKIDVFAGSVATQDGASDRSYCGC